MQYFINTIGLVINVETGQDLSSAENMVLHVKKPGGAWTQWDTGLSVVDNTKISYTTADGDLDEAGVYTVYPTLKIGTFEGAGKPARFTVYNPQDPDQLHNL